MREHDPGSDEPDLPFGAVWAIGGGGSQVSLAFVLVSEPLERLSELDLQLPVVVFADVFEEVFDQDMLPVKFVGSRLAVRLLEQLEVLEPERTEFRV